MAAKERERLDDLERARQLARERHAAGARVEIGYPEAPQSYAGPVLGETERHVVQEHGGRAGTVIIHEREALSPPASRDLTGQVVEVRYPHGNRAGVLREDLTPYQHELTGLERRERDAAAAILDREARPEDEARIASHERRAIVFAKVRSELARGSSYEITRELDRREETATREQEYAARDGDERYVAIAGGTAAAFAEARETFERGLERDVGEAERSFSQDGRDRDRTAQDAGRSSEAGAQGASEGHELGDR